MRRLTDRVAIVTGGANGIGKATALRFLEEGAKVAIWDINAEAGEATQKEFSDQGYETRFYQVNTTELEAVQQAAQTVKDDFGKIEILVNNAGITRDASLKKMTSDQWQQVIDVNLTGVFNCTKACYPFLAETGYGRIINAASVVALYGNFGQTNYVATKAGVIGMTKTWAREFGRKGITVNAIAPGFIRTEMIESVPDDILDQLTSKTPMNRLGEVADIANAYLFLASEEAGFITGTTISVDGGLVL